MVALGAICAETDAEAERVSASARLVRRRLRQGDLRPIPAVEEAQRELAQLPSPPTEEAGEWPRYFIGSAQTVRASLTALADALGIDEVMVVTIVHDHAVRLRSYELLAQAFRLNS
jgi:alkanesulfonate monooxygenase SsuD/methylene tetrahydromethanopterin reductase-like flavin-dependent oxidoreductase (luciferase family)